ncbi:hypothetical protein [Streptomyces mirabilis]|uniref:hypothetical protein n=1 Tax=Streptomyces mirabilis TaxID=68239 RepID=UPI0022540104|nr:hypothetical protein [Streptomyces mirabilis]MCX4429851.1 hypothetical protein [Streptomyces mirabilis]
MILLATSAWSSASGTAVVYALYDHHVAELLNQAVYHVEHLRLGISDATDNTLSAG